MRRLPDCETNQDSGSRHHTHETHGGIDVAMTKSEIRPLLHNDQVYSISVARTLTIAARSKPVRHNGSSVEDTNRLKAVELSD